VSWVDSVLDAVPDAGYWLADKTLGTAWEAFSGTVNPAKLELINRQLDRDIARASGLGVEGKTVASSAAVVAQKQAAAKAEVAGYLRSQGQHPDQAGLLLPGGINLDSANKVVSAVILIAAVGLGAYFLLEVGKAYLSRR
jgi:hypothetical protein